jgi:serine/threonine protein kinase/serine/threonine protein phosphatase PrpC
MHGSPRATAVQMAGGLHRLPGISPVISLGQFSQAGTKGVNQDFYGSLVPEGPGLVTKGIAFAIADGISTSDAGGRASEIAVKSFLTDYYCTPDAWSVKTSADRVIRATNSWLCAQNGRVLVDEERDRGHVCTFSALILKGRSAHIFHAGDSRVSRLSGGHLEPLTEEHRAYVSSKEIYLARALGADRNVDIDYNRVAAHPGDLFLLTTDGVHDHVGGAEVCRIIAEHPGDLDRAAKALAVRAADLGSSDDLTVQIVRVERLCDAAPGDLVEEGIALPPAPLLDPGAMFEGFEVLRSIHANSRSHIYLARDLESGARVALKVPSTELRDDPAHMRRFALEEWIARRVSSPHVLAAADIGRARRHLYVATEYLEGTSLDQWMRDHPSPELEAVRRIVEQIGKGLHAFHRREMLHQDLRPKNVMIDQSGTVKVIDFGSAFVAGLAELRMPTEANEMLGTLQYSAPEYLLGTAGDERSDIFSLGVICYEMLTGSLPFGPRRIDHGDRNALGKLRYIPARRLNPAVPDWLDATIAKAVHPQRTQRYEVVSEFLHDLRHPNLDLPIPDRGPLLQRRPELKLHLAIALLLVALLVLLVENRRLNSALENIGQGSSDRPVGYPPR